MQSLPKKITFSLLSCLSFLSSFHWGFFWTTIQNITTFLTTLPSRLSFFFFLYKLYVCSCKGQILLMMTCLMHQITFLQNSARALQMTALQVLMNKWIKAKHMELLLLFMFSTSGLTKAIDWPEKIFVEF